MKKPVPALFQIQFGSFDNDVVDELHRAEFPVFTGFSDCRRGDGLDRFHRGQHGFTQGGVLAD